MTYRLLDVGETVQEGDEFLVSAKDFLSHSGGEWKSIPQFYGMVLDSQHVVRRQMAHDCDDDGESALRHEIRHLGEEAETHRERYDDKATASQGEVNKEYWRGRRDEAGYFRDKLYKLL